MPDQGHMKKVQCYISRLAISLLKKSKENCKILTHFSHGHAQVSSVQWRFFAPAEKRIVSSLLSYTPLVEVIKLDLLGHF